MAVTSTRDTAIVFTGDVTAVQTVSAASNANSPGVDELKTLASGANTITVPTGGSVPKAVAIIPPSGNLLLMTLKGVTGDTGIAMHLTDPTILSLDLTVTTFVINAANIITGCRFIWS